MNVKNNIFENKLYSSWLFTINDLELPSSQLAERFEKRAELFAAMGVKTTIAFGLHFRWDFTDISHEVKRVFKIAVDSCHKNGIEFYDHHSVVLSHEVRNDNDRDYIKANLSHHGLRFRKTNLFYGSNLYSWVQRNSTNNLAYREIYRSIIFCSLNPDFRKKYLQMLKETVLPTGIDGLMPDDVLFPGDACCCEYCTNKFYEKTGEKVSWRESTENDKFWGNYENPLWKEWLRFKQEKVTDFHQWLKTKLINEGFEKLRLLTCCSNTHTTWVHNTGLDYFNIAPFYDITHQEVLSKTFVPYAWKDTLVTGKLLQAISKRSATPTVSLSYINDKESYIFNRFMFNAIGNDCWADIRENISGQVGLAEPDFKEFVPVSQRLNTLLNHTNLSCKPKDNIETYKITSTAEIAIVYSRATRDFFQPENLLKKYSKQNQDISIFNDVCYKESFGWGIFLLEKNLNFDFIFEEDINSSTLANYKVLILANNACFDVNKVYILHTFIKQKGHIIATGESGKYDLHGNKLATPALDKLTSHPSFNTVDYLLGKELLLPLPSHACNETKKHCTTIQIVDNRATKYKKAASQLIHAALPEPLISLQSDTNEILMTSYQKQESIIISLLNVGQTFFPHNAKQNTLFDNKHLPGLFKPLRTETVQICLTLQEIVSVRFQSFDMNEPIELNVDKRDGISVVRLDPAELSTFGVVIVNLG